MDQQSGWAPSQGMVPEPNTLAGGATENSPGDPAPPDPSGTGVGSGSKPPRRRGLLGGAIAIAAAVAVLGVKLIIGFAAASVVSVALGTVFGGPFERLPSDQQQALQQRFDAVVGDSLKGLSDADVTARVQSLEFGGLPRLDDATLVEYEGLWTSAIAAADVSSCASAARTKAGAIDLAVSDKIISSLDTQQLGRWYDIAVTAMEATQKQTPARSVSTAANDAMVTAIGQALPPADVTNLQQLSSGGTVSDTDACTAYRDLYHTAMSLDPTDRATFALSDVTP
jgi:hypothetical protein